MVTKEQLEKRLEELRAELRRAEVAVISIRAAIAENERLLQEAEEE